jgi:uncharacterized protein
MKIDRALDEYRVPFTGLKDGHHEFAFHLGKQFFEAFEYSEIENAEISVDVDLEKSANMLVFNSYLHGEVGVDCDRCGDPVAQEIEDEFRLVVKFGEQTGASDEDVLVLGPQEFEVDLAHYFYEYAHLTLPARHVHSELSECNQDVILKLEEMRVIEDSETNWIAIKDMKRSDPAPDDDEEE